tara:strand:+ start:6103 stop:6354 length:252 start_codon:yes stop_codon:yes gene_type:complete
MNDKDIYFPQFRKLSNDKLFYKVLSSREFIEIQVIGSVIKIHQIKAVQYPEILKIQDLLDLESKYYRVIFEEEYEAMKSKFEM